MSRSTIQFDVSKDELRDILYILGRSSGMPQAASSLPQLDALRFGPTFARRIENCPKEADIFTTEDLLACSAAVLLSIDKFGMGCLTSLKLTLAGHGLALAVSGQDKGA